MMFEMRLHEWRRLSDEEISDLFSQIDLDGNGMLDRLEIINLVQVLGFPATDEFVDDIFRVCLQRSPDSKTDAHENPLANPQPPVVRNYSGHRRNRKIPKDAAISKDQFIAYCHDRDRSLQALFDQIDTDKNGYLDKHELKAALAKSHVYLTKKEIDKVFSLVDPDNLNKVDYTAFRKVFLISPVSSPAGLFELWYTNSYVDNSDTVIVHMDLKRREMPAGSYYKTLASGAIAGAVSRTLTAPLDRTKMLMQIQKAQNTSGVSNTFFKTLVSIVLPNQAGSSASSSTISSRSGAISTPNISPVAFLHKLKEDVIITANKEKLQREEQIDRQLRKLERKCPRLLDSPVIKPFTKNYRHRMELLQAGKKPEINLHRLDLGALWKGNGINVFKIAPETAMKFVIFDYFKYVICKDPESPNAPERLLAGACAGVFTTTLMYPLDTVRTQIMTVKAGYYSGLSDCFKGITRNEGYIRLFKGYLPAIVGVAPFAGIDLCAYEMIKIMATKHYTDKHNALYDQEQAVYDQLQQQKRTDSSSLNDINTTNPPPLQKIHTKLANVQDEIPKNRILLLAGTVSSTIAAVLTYPLAVIRTRVMAQHPLEQERAKPQPGVKPKNITRIHQILFGDPKIAYKYNGLVGTFTVMLKEEGLASFYRGIIPNLFKVVPAVSISYLTFENTKRLLSINT